MTKVNFKTYSQLSQDVRSAIHKIPKDIDIVVGNPRSGMIPAYILGSFLNLPVSSLDEYINDIGSSWGERTIIKTDKVKKVLIIDDSITTGSALKKVKNKLKNKIPMVDYIYFAVYATEESKGLVDIYSITCEHPRVFQWNYLYHGMLEMSCVDIDGVLCKDPTPEQNDDGDEYVRFILNATPLYIPNYKIKALVTSRLEKYRKQTEEWLAKHNVRYENLYMLDLPTKEDRIKLGAHAKFKAEIYQKLKDCILFIESDRSQAIEIAEITGKSTICLPTDEVFPLRLEEIDKEKESLFTLKKEVEKLEEEIKLKDRVITSMRSSRVWRLRDYYIKIKPREILKRIGSHKRNPRTLVVVNHYYGKGNNFKGKSITQDKAIRKEIVEKVITEIKKIPNVDIKICGIKDRSLFKIDKDFSYLKDPSFLIYESIEWMSTQVGKYDYFINIEDDILLTRKTFNRIIKFDRKNNVNECFHPNRMEKDKNGEYCVDLKAWSGWKDQSKRYNGLDLRVANNPHSGLAILSREKLLFALDKTDLKRRDKIIGHYMASAYANLHQPFSMFRSYSDISAHEVIHLDRWETN